MNQPPEHPQSPAPRGPSRAAASEASPAGAQRPEAERATRAGKGPLLAAVGCGLLALVLVLSLLAFFGMRAYLAGDEPSAAVPHSADRLPGQDSTNPAPRGRFVVADGLPQDEALVEGQWVEAA